MAGETQKTTALTNRDAGTNRNGRLSKGKEYTAIDTHSFAAATELEAGDNLIMDINIPSNAIITSIKHINDDLDTHACSPTLVIDGGVAAGEDYKSVTSGTTTYHNKDDIIDADLFIDGNTALRAATTDFTEFASKDGTTFGPEDRAKPIWELLGYDNDPNTTYRLVLQSQAASAALSAAGDLTVLVKYITD